MLSHADNRQIDRVLTLVGELLGSDVVAAYLFGSAVLGGLRPESDLDILVVSKRPTTRAEKQHLVDRLMTASGRRTSRGTWRRIELTIVVERDVKPWRYPPTLDFQYGDWLRSQFHGGNPEVWAPAIKPDLALLIAMVIQAKTPLHGPPPDQIFDPVPQRELVKVMVGDIDRLRGDIDSDTRNVVLTLARIWITVATGVIRSKDAAADWALRRLPRAYRPVLTRARAIYLGERAESWGDLEGSIVPHVDYVIAEIKRLVSDSYRSP